MHSGILIWLILFGFFGICFFVIAAYVAVTGVGDVKALLTRPSRQKTPGADEEA